MSVFTQPDTGYCNWKKALTSSGFANHAGERCSKHKTAETALTNLLQTDHDIGLALNRQSLTERQADYDRIKTILDICILLARQGLPFRGHGETEN
ncbi:hypothetical protein PF010_g9074 [Phytophthora fragariae]|uniref:Uncharacterized protein n=1 Tax=Phytophthora fragariae TaxID=53985 RepID=A0A6A3F2Z4_9STRA|nr:hypothetical protein PF009_g10079 [Phytophthora fragariae]KAE9116119.1 hypothetical protein PF010_g9074 [Phytophthora fragariae]KAE9146425.1 hypothetical protein PF006_g8805 [Phytophthora fragariae]KAE9236731.1 hypothetical protein PF004_g8770 [Phytophthora fragariae]KAE9248329.1 hypothetical protein PF002_g5842 [Phytophthora fragariae]